MAQEVDSSTKVAFNFDPRPWLALAGFDVTSADAVGAVTEIDPTMPSVAMSADKLVRVETPDGPVLIHIEFQNRHDPTIAWRMLKYNVWARDKYGLPVWSVIFLFRPEAASGVTGRVFDGYDDRSLFDFRYHVVRVWELPVEPLLAGPIATLPLATVAAPRSELMPVAERVYRRLADEVPPSVGKDFAEVVRVFASLRLEKADPLLEQLMASFAEMIESSPAYQMTLEKGRTRGMAEGRAEGRADGVAEGRVEAARRMLLDLGTERFGTPSPADRATVQASSEEALNRLTRRLLSAADWADLLASR